MPLPLAGVAGAAGAVRIGSWAARALPQVAQAISGLASIVPQLDDEVTVEIVGQPGSSKKNLYFLALAAANALARRFQSSNKAGTFIAPPTGMIMLEYDAADNWVRCTIRYKTSSLPLAVKGKASVSLEELSIYAGPKCDVVGEQFNFTGALAVGGIPRSSTSSPAPQLPFEKRTILTNCPSVRDPAPGFGPPGPDIIPTPNPKPVGDNRSRGAAVVAISQGAEGASNDDCCFRRLDLIPLVFSSLSDPGSFGDEVFRVPTLGQRGN